MGRNARVHLMFLAVLLALFSPAVSAAARFKVLVVMSYEESYDWQRDIREGIETVLGDKAEITFFNMDTKNNLENGPEKAREAFDVYRTIQPDGVIAADDNAQSMFVVPYLKDKVDTPVIFCGVNADIATYGYPASNVTGVTEHLYIGESITFAQQLVPSIQKVGFIEKDSPSGRAVVAQVNKESENYPVVSVDFKLPKTFAEAKAIVEQFKGEVDALFMETLEGIPDENGKPLSDRVVFPILAEIFGKPVISSNLFHVEYGTLCAVVKLGQEQGERAATLLLEAMQGKDVADIPVTTGKKGLPVLNVTVMKKLGIKPQPSVLKGVKLVETRPKFKVLVVMSYEEDFLWDSEVKEGIESVLGKMSDIHYFYMDTKTNIAGGPQKAKEAYELYQQLQPDGIIAADDNAQAMFVVPYVKDKVQTPVIFCGVNADPAKYGYPAVNVSGVLERAHIRESIALLQELMPEVRTIAYMARKNPTGEAVLQQAKQEAEGYSAQSVAFLLPETLQEATDMARDMTNSADALFVATMQGLSGDNNRPLSEKEVLPIVEKAFGKPIITDNVYDLKYGFLCAVAVSGQEQGQKAGKKLFSAMQGTPIAQIPITRNDQGRRVINVSAMKALGIIAHPNTLIGAELIKSED